MIIQNENPIRLDYEKLKEVFINNYRKYNNDSTDFNVFIHQFVERFIPILIDEILHPAKVPYVYIHFYDDSTNAPNCFEAFPLGNCDKHNTIISIYINNIIKRVETAISMGHFTSSEGSIFYTNAAKYFATLLFITLVHECYHMIQDCPIYLYSRALHNYYVEEPVEWMTSEFVMKHISYMNNQGLFADIKFEHPENINKNFKIR